jgi:hypothetical protein
MVCMCLIHKRHWGSRVHVLFAADKALRERLSWEWSVYFCHPSVHPHQQCVVWHSVTKRLMFLWMYTQWCRWIALRNFGIKLETLLGTTHLYSVRLSFRLPQLLCHFQKQFKLEPRTKVKKRQSFRSVLVRICTGSSTCSWKPLYSPDDKFIPRSEVLFVKLLLAQLIKIFSTLNGNQMLSSCSQAPVTENYPELGEFIPHPNTLIFKINFNINLPSMPRSSKRRSPFMFFD